MSDPVADKSTFLSMYMTNHPDTLVAYVKHFGKVTEHVTSAEMKAIDSKSMTLAYKTKEVSEKRTVKVEFDPPLAGYEEVKPRLLGMKAEAQEGLGMIKAPQLANFQMPWRGSFMSGLYVLTFFYLTLPPKGPLGDHVIFTPPRAISSAIGFEFAPKVILGIFGGIHLLEAVYTYSLCRKYVKGFFPTVAYLVGTCIFGFPMWTDLRKRVQDARIESVMKVE
ncbi:hypothetical protein SERLA73DRAFT_184529 [Serpula lacrymans var. lacrymans S7.3]|uniref:DUF2470 domain-containing protein n=2 Tax=Serpula lacrymans var. lacrymans TaxID=341189 RepID=F8Q3F0_SERL3|nr:uncharacterized protein SERLADRAFT_472256 [Serpula lacrymans var. lacrymans S7.9]EGN97711.1 hypothetical protein SERLA73DRAFT_184529 [Serpula lacrymans var. lacrymans S7.3]EGO23302.1 hypothetical protein SERLADRAFT_472256 [Serpula lacrymans var. lacrymans S7.9]